MRIKIKVNNVYNFKGKFQMRRIKGIISHMQVPYTVLLECVNQVISLNKCQTDYL
jgi:hypothetical protein